MSIAKSIVFESEEYALPLPVTVQPGCVSDARDHGIKTNAVSLIKVEDAKVYFDGARCLVRARSGEIVASYGLSSVEISQFQWNGLSDLAGTSMLLADSKGAHCYYHWMVDILPKIPIIQRGGIPISSVNRFLAREANKPFQRETLAKCGISQERILETRDCPLFRCEELVLVAMNNGINMKMHRFIPSWLNSLFSPVSVPGESLRLYVRRPKGVRRSILNEEEILPLFRRAGFTEVQTEGLAVHEQAQLFSRAEAVISPHGGALTNMIFCRPGCKILELFGSHVYPFYYGLSQVCNHVYHALFESVADYPKILSFSNAVKAGAIEFQLATRDKDFVVDPNALEAMLGAMGYLDSEQTSGS